MPNERTGFQLYPNPTSREVQLEFDLPAGEVAQMKVYNLFGQAILRSQWDTFEGRQTESIAVDQLPPGTYMLELRAGEQRYTSKFTVTR